MSRTLTYPVNALVSYHYYRTIDVGHMAEGGLRMIGDSGAFSAHTSGTPVSVPAFAAWATRWRDALVWVASLDVIGDSAGTWKNYRTLRDTHGLDVVPTLHYGADPSGLDAYANDGVDFVGLGGMVGRKSQPKHLLRWCLHVFRYARDNHPAMRFHGWGVTHPQLLEALPWYSVDSSGAGASYRYGVATLYDPRSHKKVRVRMDGRAVHRHRDLLTRFYGLEPGDVAASTPSTRAALIRCAARSNQLIEMRLRQKFKVAAPSYGVREPVVGPSVHLPVATGGPTKPTGEVRALLGPTVHGVLNRANPAPGGEAAVLVGDEHVQRAGPHVHAVDGSAANLRLLQHD